MTSEYDESTELQEGTEGFGQDKPPFGAGFVAVVEIFHAPSKVGEQIKRGLSWWPGLIVLVLLALIGSVIMMPVHEEMVGIQLEAAGMGANGEMALEQATKVGKISSFLMPVVGAPVGLLFVALFYWLALLLTFGEVRFGRVFALTVYVAPIISLFNILSSLYLRFTDPEFTSAVELAQASLNLSLGAIIGDPGTFLHGFLTQLSLSNLWALIAFIIAAAVTLNKRWRSVAWPVGLVFMLGVIIAAGMAMMGSKFAVG